MSDDWSADEPTEGATYGATERPTVAVLVGPSLVAAVSPTPAPVLADAPWDEIVIGDLRDALLFEVREFTIQRLEELDKIDSRVAAVRDCAILNMCGICGTAAARVIKAGIHPMRIESGTPIEGLLDRFVRVLAGGAPPWLRKAMDAHVPPVWPLAPHTGVDRHPASDAGLNGRSPAGSPVGGLRVRRPRHRPPGDG